MGEATEKFTDDVATLCVCGRALWLELHRATIPSPSGRDPALFDAIATARQNLGMAFMPPMDRQMLLEAIEDAALVLFAVSHATA